MFVEAYFIHLSRLFWTACKYRRKIEVWFYDRENDLIVLFSDHQSYIIADIEKQN